MKKQINKKVWLIIANKSDCGDLSVYKFTGTEEDAFKRMQNLMLISCLDAGESQVDQMITSDMYGYIRYIDEEHEDFRCICIGDIPKIETADGFNPEPNWDAFPEKFDMDMEAIDYTVHDIGRE